MVTSPPYGPSTHGQVVSAGTGSPDGKVHKYHHRYGSALDRGNLANVGHHRLLAGFTRILTGCAAVLREGLGTARLGPVRVEVTVSHGEATLTITPSDLAGAAADRVSTLAARHGGTADITTTGMTWTAPAPSTAP